MDLVEKARVFATAAHAAVAQRRKYTGEPYIVHPIEVMEIVKTVAHTPEMLAAALLHDVIEDTQMDSWTILDEFGRDITMLVGELTDSEYPSDCNREKRKGLEVIRWFSCSDSAKIIKCADIISNTSSIVEHDKDFSSVYLEEMCKLLPALRVKDSELHARAMRQVDAQRRLCRSVNNV